MSPASTYIDSGVPTNPPSFRVFWMRTVIVFAPGVQRARGISYTGRHRWPRTRGWCWRCGTAAAARRGRGCGLRRGNRRGGERQAVHPHFSVVADRAQGQRRGRRSAPPTSSDPREPHDAVEIRQAARFPVAGNLHVLPVARRAPRLPAFASPAWCSRSGATPAGTGVGQRVAIGVIRGREALLLPRRGDVERAAQPLVAVVRRDLALGVERLPDLVGTPACLRARAPPRGACADRDP